MGANVFAVKIYRITLAGFKCAVMILSIQTGESGQTVQMNSRLLLNLVRVCLLFCLLDVCLSLSVTLLQILG